jgi:hypothetical protein
MRPSEGFKIGFVIPGRGSEAQANPESSNQRLLGSGFSIIGLRPYDLAPE